MVSADMRNKVFQLLDEGKNSADIAYKLGVPKQAIAAIKAHRTMGTYSENPVANQEETEKREEALETTFSLERDLQDALLKNIQQLEPDLKVVEGGKEFAVPSGRIDILASDAKQCRVVIELKTGSADRDSIGQVLSYMGDLKLAKPGIQVRGILLAGDFTERAIAAATAVPTIKLMKYSFKFSFYAIGS
jgi:RecB family endonuclease NucS